MRWFRRTPTSKPGGLDPVRQDSLIQEIRSRFEADVQPGFGEQADALVPLLDGDDGLSVAVRIVHDVSNEANANVLAQVAELNRRLGRGYVLDGRNYRPLWQQAGPELRSSFTALPCGFHPYIHLAAALTVVGANARRCVRLTDPVALMAQVLALLDLVTAGWEFGGDRVDADAAALASGLITAAQHLRTAMSDPPPLPSAARELMRRNNTTDIYDPTGATVVAGINVGERMRAAFLT
jgi:hypothetical protein